MKKRKISALIIVFTMIVSSWTIGYSSMHEFRDMPDNWSTEALQNAVDNGLLNGADGKIMPGDNLTRAQMATVINRAFGAQTKANISNYTDVSTGVWYHDEMAKAVQMKTFQGAENRLNPADAITREQAFIVMARALKLSSTDVEVEGFSDLAEISSWAKEEVLSMIAAGYVQGSFGRINPKSTITRAEFAQLMDNLIKQYINVAGEYTEVVEGNIMINVPDVTLKGVKVTGDLILGDGVGDGDVILDGVEVTGRLLIRGGGKDTIIIKGDSNIQSIVIARVNGIVRVYNQTGEEIGEVIVDGGDDVILDGRFGHIEVLADNVDVYALRAVFTGSNISGENSQIILPDIDDRESVRSVSIEGDTDVSWSTISAVVVPSDATVQYKWLISDTFDGEYVALEGETSATLEIIPDDIGKFIKVEARGTGDYRRTRTSNAVVIGFGGFDVARGAYEIANWHHLDNIRFILDGDFVMTANIGAPEEVEYNVAPSSAPSVVYETKGYDEVVGDRGFEPIGRPMWSTRSVTAFTEEDGFLSQLFTGTFDGNNHTIKGLYVDQEIYTKDAPLDIANAAGLFGIIYQAEIKNLTIKDSGIFGRDFVGALAGYSRESVISNVHNSSEFRMIAERIPSGVVFGDTRVGGIVGINDSGTITNSSNKSIVVGGEFVGGIAGSNHVDAYDTSPSVMIVIEPSFETYITDSWNEGPILGNRYVGGIAGSNSNEYLYATSNEIQRSLYYPKAPTYVNRCYNYGEIVPFDIMYVELQSIGGIVGANTGTISESYNEGVVGYQELMNLSLDTLEIAGISYEAFEVGGIAGIDYNGEISNNYNKGSIYGVDDIGGIVGYAYASEIMNNYNVGHVDGTIVDDLTQVSFYGQTIFGYEMDAYFVGNYFLSEVIDERMVEAMKGYYGIYGASIEELRNPLTYLQEIYYRDLVEESSWDFEDIWFMDLQTNNGLPILRWEDEMYATEPSLSVTMPAFTLTYGQDASQAVIVSEGEVEAYGQPLDGEFTIIENLEWFTPGEHYIKTSFSETGDSGFLTLHGYSQIVVSNADLTITADNKSKTYDGNTFSPFTISYSGFVYNDGTEVVYGFLGFTGSAITAVDAGTYTITPYGQVSYYYDLTYADGTLTINKANPSVTWPETIYALRNEVITEDHFTDESSTLSGTFSITDDTTSWSEAGTYGLEVTFTPSDSVNYNTVSSQINVVVEELIYEKLNVRRSSDEIDLLFNLPVNQNVDLEADDFLILLITNEGENEIEIDEIVNPTGAFDYFTIKCYDDSLAINSLITVTIKPSGVAKLVDNGGNLINTDVLTRIYGIVYEEDFEADNGGFTHSGILDEWEWGTPSTWPHAAASGLKCWGTDLDGNYENNANMTLLSPEVDLTYVPADMPVNIQWMQAWQLESSWWDPASVQYTIDNGSTWIDLWVFSGSSVTAPWQRLSQDISAAAGQTVQFRWVFTTDGSVTYSGIYIDDILIEAGNYDFSATEIIYPVGNMGMEKEVQSE
jgi:hypothetical protein